MTYGFDNVAATDIGAAVAEVQLNGAASLRVPAGATGIVEVIPYYSQLGAFTTDETVMIAMRIQSDDVAIEPKRFVLPVTNIGDGAFTSVLCPALKAYPLNIPLSGSERINYFGQSQVAQTVGPTVGATVVYTEGGLGLQQYYQKPDNESNGGTTINTRASGNTITITGGGMINGLYAIVAMPVALLSEHTVGFMEFQSSDFDTSMPYRVAVQPTFAGLSATAASLTGGAGLMEYNLPAGQEIPLLTNVTINTFYTNNDAKGGADVFIGVARYHK